MICPEMNASNNLFKGALQPMCYTGMRTNGRTSWMKRAQSTLDALADRGLCDSKSTDPSTIFWCASPRLETFTAAERWRTRLFEYFSWLAPLP